MGRYASGQRKQTVNLLSKGFVGSNPTLPTKSYSQVRKAWDFDSHIRGFESH